MAQEHLLVVDADAKTQKILKISFQKTTHDVRFVSTLAEARAHIAAEIPALIIAETHLPDGDGFAFCVEVKAAPATRDVPFLFVTDRTANPDKLRGIEAGADEYIAKPFYNREIVSRVELALQRRAQSVLGAGEDMERVEGTLDEITVIDLLQAIERDGKSGIIQLQRENTQATVYFREGDILDALCGKVQGEEAIYRLMLWPNGTFTITYHDISPRVDHIDPDASELLINGLSRLEQWNELLQAMPSLSRVYESDLSDAGRMPADVGRLLRLFDGFRTLRDVVDDSHLDDITTLRIIKKLLDGGQLLDVSDDAVGEAAQESNLASWLSEQDAQPQRTAPITSSRARRNADFGDVKATSPGLRSLPELNAGGLEEDSTPEAPDDFLWDSPALADEPEAAKKPTPSLAEYLSEAEVIAAAAEAIAAPEAAVEAEVEVEAAPEEAPEDDEPGVAPPSVPEFKTLHGLPGITAALDPEDDDEDANAMPPIEEPAADALSGSTDAGIGAAPTRTTVALDASQRDGDPEAFFEAMEQARRDAEAQQLAALHREAVDSGMFPALPRDAQQRRTASTPAIIRNEDDPAPRAKRDDTKELHREAVLAEIERREAEKADEAARAAEVAAEAAEVARKAAEEAARAEAEARAAREAIDDATSRRAQALDEAESVKRQTAATLRESLSGEFEPVRDELPEAPADEAPAEEIAAPPLIPLGSPEDTSSEPTVSEAESIAHHTRAAEHVAASDEVASDAVASDVAGDVASEEAGAEDSASDAEDAAAGSNDHIPITNRTARDHELIRTAYDLKSDEDSEADAADAEAQPAAEVQPAAAAVTAPASADADEDDDDEWEDDDEEWDDEDDDWDDEDDDEDEVAPAAETPAPAAVAAPAKPETKPSANTNLEEDSDLDEDSDAEDEAPAPAATVKPATTQAAAEAAAQPEEADPWAEFDKEEKENNTAWVLIVLAAVAAVVIVLIALAQDNTDTTPSNTTQTTARVTSNTTAQTNNTSAQTNNATTATTALVDTTQTASETNNTTAAMTTGTADTTQTTGETTAGGGLSEQDAPALAEQIGKQAHLTSATVALLTLGVDLSKVEDPRTYTAPPKTDPPKTDPPKTDPPKTDPPKTDPPKTDPKPRPVASFNQRLARAEKLMNDGKDQQALRELTKLQSEQSNNPKVALMLGQTYQYLGQKANARKAYQHYLKLRPTGKDADDVRTILKNALK